MSGFSPIHGHCLCGAVRYRVEAPATELYHCHCGMCRRSHGAVFGTYAWVPREALIIEQGEENLATYDSSKATHRRFCRTCGCQLFAIDDTMPETVIYTPGTTDGHPGHTPHKERHFYVGSKLCWYEIENRRRQLDAP